jgi:hypothetical protein
MAKALAKSLFDLIGSAAIIGAWVGPTRRVQPLGYLTTELKPSEKYSQTTIYKFSPL